MCIGSAPKFFATLATLRTALLGRMPILEASDRMDRLAERHGWTVTKGPRGHRTYRDSRFDRLAREVQEVDATPPLEAETDLEQPAELARSRR